MMRIGRCLARLRSPLARFFGGVKKRGGEDRDTHTEELGHFSSSWGRWPGHEVNFPVLTRILWELGKSRERAARDEDGEEDRPAGSDRSGYSRR
jgi:hypothetical protein